MTTEIARLRGQNITKKLPPDELEARILDFFKEQTMCTICTSKDDGPRGTPLEYFNEGMNLYILADPGVKIRNIEANPRVCVSMYNNVYPDWPAEVWRTVKAAQVTGEAMLMKQEHPEYLDALEVYHWEPYLISLGRDPKERPRVRNIIKVVSRKIEYSEMGLMAKGYAARQVWEAPE